jgi:hypothetical protein
MADTIEKRVQDLEHVIAHLPQDLDARFAGVHARLGEVRDAVSAQTRRLDAFETRLGVMDTRLGAVNVGVNSLEARLSKVETAVSDIRQLLDDRLPRRS